MRGSERVLWSSSSAFKNWSPSWKNPSPDAIRATQEMGSPFSSTNTVDVDANEFTPTIGGVDVPPAPAVVVAAAGIVEDAGAEAGGATVAAAAAAA
eukprot:CAMPEP_0206569634 /NCGR_PEP_ID=MMETSP0325_2-20121206/26550_1 /ASSEMBLY_ACC=CAM_ASM_000347 /TAXON_ID=2866 /ORGANISM="Crypthecodinium cohnii, Strain Seligo" /LENGTH=95 /DNA_ID=CAMNT_0054073251 /DNA_START=203 /DNA_END=486 /DNA_ORIENTATION=+